MGTKLDQIASWCRPVKEGDSLLFKHAYRIGSDWYDIKVLRQGVNLEGTLDGEKLQEIQRIALEKIFPHLAAPTQIVTYVAVPEEKCCVDQVAVQGEVLEGMRKIDEALKRAFGDRVEPVELSGREQPILNHDDYIGTVDLETQGERFDPKVSYAQFREEAKQKPESLIYQTYLKVVQNPADDSVDTLRMRKWLEALHRSATHYLKEHYVFRKKHEKEGEDFERYCKIEAAKHLFYFVYVENISVQKLIDHLISNEL